MNTNWWMLYCMDINNLPYIPGPVWWQRHYIHPPPSSVFIAYLMSGSVAERTCHGLIYHRAETGG